MRRLIQLLQILFSDKIFSAVEHYHHPELIDYYVQKITEDLSADEKEVEEKIKALRPQRLLVYGAGTGRECRHFCEQAKTVVGYEPVQAMLERAYQARNLSYTSVAQFEGGSFDCIF